MLQHVHIKQTQQVVSSRPYRNACILKADHCVNREDRASSTEAMMMLTAAYCMLLMTNCPLPGPSVASLARPVYLTHPKERPPLPPISTWLHPPDPWLVGEGPRGGRGGVRALTEARPASRAGPMGWRVSLGVTLVEYWLQGLSPRDR